MTLICTDNMTNNIHYPSMSGGVTAKSLEGMVIGMDFTIGIPSILEWRRFTLTQLCKREVDRGSRGLMSTVCF